MELRYIRVHYLKNIFLTSYSHDKSGQTYLLQGSDSPDTDNERIPVAEIPSVAVDIPRPQRVKTPRPTVVPSDVQRVVEEIFVMVMRRGVLRMATMSNTSGLVSVV
jgi:hypothetical protein